MNGRKDLQNAARQKNAILGVMHPLSQTNAAIYLGVFDCPVSCIALYFDRRVIPSSFIKYMPGVYNLGVLRSVY